MKQILIIQTAFLGDVILATPVISELKRCFPEAQIDFLLKKGNESLLKNRPDIQEVFIFNKAEGKWKSIFRLLRQIRSKKYDLVINLHRFGSSGILSGFSKAKKIYGFKKHPYSFLFNKKFPHIIGDGTHEVERNLSLIKEFGSQRMARPSLYPSDEDFQAIQPFVREEYYCMAPSSVWFTKQLPLHKWIEFIKLLGNKTIYLLGGPEDVGLCSEIIEKSDSEMVSSLAGKLTLLQSAAIMQTAKRNYVNDSGPLHIASAMNANVTAFFCSTIPDFGFGPLSDDSDIREVRNLDCRPCGLHGHNHCPKGHFKCGELIQLK